MNKWKVNYFLDLALFLSALGLALSGFIPWLILPAGRYGRQAFAPGFIFSRQGWVEIHRLLAIVMVGLVLVHLYLHWDWIANMTRRILGGRDKVR
ncbi:DUF4405 domain-containing protein [Neomoorella thermoacetica]|uniref:DUF4405 domain-containing protein n=1 Tax=Neomoorella thermoacetica TaxID=1525 RepID=UPI000471BF73|nr:DUF4405 domain-containing protein [Moorella thermoacetica]